MSVLIVTESLFGNTLHVAEAIGAGIAEVRGRGSVRVLHASCAPEELPADLDLLVVGAPTHTLSLPDAGTRADAIRRGAAADAHAGVREWIDHVTIPDRVSVATFDTSVHSRIQLGTAARAAARALRRRGARTTVGPSFWVTGMEGPLADGELTRATEWGRRLARETLAVR
ncbi:flavodoxin family protein [Propionicimonas sp.]|uniref:flavodoxin family protein n=1 Tax=Propionicimonas sp. TaxID=1955623 RepID=UPI0039E3A414